MFFAPKYKSHLILVNRRPDSAVQHIRYSTYSKLYIFGAEDADTRVMAKLAASFLMQLSREENG